jgi:hypothetical protein
MSNTIEKEMIYHETKSENGINDQKQKAAHVQSDMKVSPGMNPKQTPVQFSLRL